jgi:sarcosine oxidase subunit gamma
VREASADWNAFAGRTKVRLRVSTAAAEEAARRLHLPGALCARASDDLTALWLGPDQWLLVSDRLSPSACEQRCASVLGAILHHTVDVSAALACARLYGKRVRELLAMGSGVDWRTGAFPEGGCLRTRFARILVIAHAADAGAVELYYDRSYRAYLERWCAYAIGDPLFAGTSCPSTC